VTNICEVDGVLHSHIPQVYVEPDTMDYAVYAVVKTDVDPLG